MARQNSALEYSTFIKGLITEGTPLTQPDNSSKNERNFELEKGGSRKRRIGIDFEDSNPDGNYQAAGLYYDVEPPVGTFTWNNAGGTTDSFIVVQVANYYKIYKNDGSGLYNNTVFNFTQSTGAVGVAGEVDSVASYSVLSGMLVITTGSQDIVLINWDGSNFTKTEGRIKVRDLFGVPAVAPRGVQGSIVDVDLTEGNGVGFRPNSDAMTGTNVAQHIYNLRNQGWAPLRKNEENELLMDPIANFASQANILLNPTSGDILPANSDNVLQNLYPDPDNSSDRISDRYWGGAAAANPLGNYPAPKGHFVIDLFDRAASRREAIANYENENNNIYTAEVPLDQTWPGGPICTASYGGRAWFAGFPGEATTNQPDKAPNLTAYLAFSTLVKDPSDVFKCYQIGDPTSKEDSDLVDTDGGLMEISGAGRITGLKEFGGALVVFTDNGMWKISGGSDYGFSATDYKVEKLSHVVLSSRASIVEVEGALLFWAKDGIYKLGINQSLGSVSVDSVSANTVQSYYNSIPPLDKLFSAGHYDRYDRKVRWLFGNRNFSNSLSRELVLDVDLVAFSINEFSNVGDRPVAKAYIDVKPYEVNYKLIQDAGQFREHIYLITRRGVEGDPREFAFALLKDLEFKDWASNFRGDGPYYYTSYLVTSSLTGQDHQRSKQLPYLTMHFSKTEDGFEFEELPNPIEGFPPIVTDNIILSNPSGCIVQARFDWHDSDAGGGWGREFQAYRFKRHYFPTDVNDPFDTGETVITTKNKIRGKGKSISLLIKSEEGKDCRILGWSMIVGVSGNV